MSPSFKPYLIRAVYEWCADQRFSPYLAVAVDASCKVPMAHVRNGQIVLDISMDATKGLDLGLEAISFQARFGGVAQSLYVPMHRVLGIFPEHDQSLGAFFEVGPLPDASLELPSFLRGTSRAAEKQSRQQNPQQSPPSQADVEQSVEPSAHPFGKPRFTRVK